jgi:putative addiction module component (TIGR02574 family)
MQRPRAFDEGYARRMTKHAQALLREALSLSDDERAELIAELLVSLEGPVVDDVEAVEQAWAEELETRARRVLAGPAQGEEWSQVRARLGRALTDG